jgi:hypothetical protein
MLTGLVFILIMVVISVIVGWSNAWEIDIMLLIKKYNNPYFQIGVSFDIHPTQDEEFIEQELTIGLFLFSIVLVFYKEKINA